MESKKGRRGAAERRGGTRVREETTRRQRRRRVGRKIDRIRRKGDGSKGMRREFEVFNGTYLA